MNIQRVSKLAACAAAIAWFLCPLSAEEIPAQKTKAPAKSAEVWYLSFEVTVKGNSSKARGERGEVTDSWYVDRTYSGVIELNLSVPTSVEVNKAMSPAEMISRVRSAPLMWVHRGSDWSDTAMVIHIKIHDKKVLVLKEKGEGDTFENTTNTITWDGEGDALADNAVQLFIDKNRSLYNVTIPFQLHMADRLLKKLTNHTVERSDHGYGDEPTHEQKLDPEDIPLGTFSLPKVIALLTGGRIHHPNNLPFSLNSGSFDWDSGDVDPDEPIFNDIPESKKGIKIHVYYLIKKASAD
jgi:hypothetical protein